MLSGNGRIVTSSMVKDLYKQGEAKVLGNDHITRTLSPPEEKFLSQLFDIMEGAWNENEFTVLDFARKLGVSKSQLYRKILSLTGYSPNDFIKEIRLSKAAKLIAKQECTISEVAYQSGFTSPSYFSKCFQKRFNILPSDYATTVASCSSF